MPLAGEYVRAGDYVGVVDFEQETADVTLSTTAGTYTDVVVGNPIAVRAGRRYKITSSGGDNLLIGGSSFASTDAWKQKFLVDEGAGYIALPLDGESYVARGVAAAATRYPIPVKVAYYVPAADDTVTSVLDTGTGPCPLTLTVEDIGEAV
jgi:hypothetical protein